MLHGVFPFQQFVEPDFVHLVLVAEHECKRIGSLAPRPDHVVDEAGFVGAAEELGSALLKLIFEDIQSGVEFSDGTWGARKNNFTFKLYKNLWQVYPAAPDSEYIKR